jgi:hypothetical protein
MTLTFSDGAVCFPPGLFLAVDGRSGWLHRCDLAGGSALSGALEAESACDLPRIVDLRRVAGAAAAEPPGDFVQRAKR